MEHISKGAQIKSAFIRPAELYPNARSGFKSLMLRMDVSRTGGVLLPSYVGWSAKEGSGVFDPVKEIGTPYAFYNMTKKLHIDLDDLERKLADLRPRMVLFIHYFGFPDPNVVRAAEISKAAGAFVVEDEAHALYSDLIGKACGRLGEASFFSLHKMLPLDSGGVVLYNRSRWCRGKYARTNLDSRSANLIIYDLAYISHIRIRNTSYLLEKLKSLSSYLIVLRSKIPAGVVPQSFPVLLKKAPRDEIYAAMNKEGYGVISLYHTLIPEVREDIFPSAHWISKRILNLPVHQDVTRDGLDSFVSTLKSLLKKYN